MEVETRLALIITVFKHCQIYEFDFSDFSGQYDSYKALGRVESKQRVIAIRDLLEITNDLLDNCPGRMGDLVFNLQKLVFN